MNAKDEFTYYFKRIFRKEMLLKKRDNSSYNSFYNHRCIFVHIPKTAGLSVSVSLLGKRIAHLTALDYRTLYGKDEFAKCFKFSIIRNPYTRLISAFEFVKKGGYGPKDSDIVSIVRNYKSLPDFVINFLQPGIIDNLKYFRPQHYYICNSNGRILVDYLGRFENIEHDYEVIRQTINTGKPLMRLNVTVGDKSSIDNYFPDEKMLSRVSSLYRKDFDILNYSTDISMIE